VLIGLLAGLSVFSTAFLVVLCLCGAAIVGSQFCLNAVVNQYYGSAIRATASGYASGAGRLGAVAAPVVGSMVVHPSTPHGFAIAIGMVPAALALVALTVLLRAAPLEQSKG
jgi:MFS family permease